MYYRSTRNSSLAVTASEAIVKGLSYDGGLFVPENLPCIKLDELCNLSKMTYNERANYILKKFLTDFTQDEIKSCVDKAYNKEKFETDSIAPLYKLSDNLYILELWHGPTCAFKDMALQILPHLLTKSMEKAGVSKEVAILVATSGDTGKAALEGFKDVDKTRIIVFYPVDGVSEIQRLQMTTQEGSNVGVAAVHGNFDDAQNGVKAIFTDDEYNKFLAENNIILSSANSINWGRLVPQIVYYFSAYCDLLKNEEIKNGDEVNFVVPTGNFGNILAAYYAKRMGLPVKKLICASNSNNVLTHFITSGTYDRKRNFNTTISPSMDILISSNLERFLFDITDCNDEKTNDWMNELRQEGKYTVDDETLQKIKNILWAGFCDDENTLKTIAETEKERSYVLDTHTSVAMNVYNQYIRATGDSAKTVIASTASPFKFGASVLRAITGDEEVDKNEFVILDDLSKASSMKIPKSLYELSEKPIRFKETCNSNEMKAMVNTLLGLNK